MMQSLCSTSGSGLYHTRAAGRGTPHTPTTRLLVVCPAVKEKGRKNVCCSKTLVAKQESKEAVLKLCSGLVEFSNSAVDDPKTGVLVFQCVRDQVCSMSRSS